jgi:hypothetical protein
METAMTNDAQATRRPAGAAPGLPAVADRATFQAELDRLPAWPGGRPIAQWSRLAAGRSDDLAGN